jgi:hypothetical protein
MKAPPRSQPIPSRQWQRPWLVDDDLKSDDVIEIGCPDIVTGERLLIKFPTSQIRAFMRGDNPINVAGGLVVHRDLTKDLVHAYGNYGRQYGRPPEAIEHLAFPFKRFAPFTIKTYRTMEESVLPAEKAVRIPAQVQVLIFLAVDKKIAVPTAKLNGSGR